MGSKRKRPDRWQAAQAVWLKWWRRPWSRRVIIGVAAVLALFVVVTSYYYVLFARQIDARLHGERERVLPRVFARPIELYQGQAVSDRQLVDRLNDLGYVQKTQAGNAGEFASTEGIITIVPRGGTFRGREVRVTFRRARTPTTSKKPVVTLGVVTGPITRLEVVGGKPVSRVTLEPPLLTALINT